MKKFVSLGLSLFLFCVSLTVLYLSMRAVMSIGGSCAEGGPYVIARPCPKNTAWLLPLSIWVGMGAALWYFVARSKVAQGPHWGVFFWSALFISLGYNFFEFGFFAPGADGVVWGFAICAIMFFLMGGLPLYTLAMPIEGKVDSFAAMLIGKPTDQYRWVLVGIHLVAAGLGIFIGRLLTSM